MNTSTKRRWLLLVPILALPAFSQTTSVANAELAQPPPARLTPLPIRVSSYTLTSSMPVELTTAGESSAEVSSSAMLCSRSHWECQLNWLLDNSQKARDKNRWLRNHGYTKWQRYNVITGKRRAWTSKNGMWRSSSAFASSAASPAMEHSYSDNLEFTDEPGSFSIQVESGKYLTPVAGAQASCGYVNSSTYASVWWNRAARLSLRSYLCWEDGELTYVVGRYTWSSSALANISGLRFYPDNATIEKYRPYSSYREIHVEVRMPWTVQACIPFVNRPCQQVGHGYAWIRHELLGNGSVRNRDETKGGWPT